MKIKNTGSTFISGVLLLTAANLLTKVIGLIFKIPLTNMLGNEGMGYFNTAYQIYTWLYMLSTAGVPVALSMMVSEYNASGKRANAKKLFRITFSLFALFGAIGSLAMMLFSKNLAAFISADKAYLCILAISPALFFVCISSTFRGYFQGCRNMLPTALSEIIESSLKLIIGIALGYYALSKGYELYRVAAYSIFGITIGVLAGALFLTLSSFASKLLSRPIQEDISNTDNSKYLTKTFFKIAIPVMLSSSLLSMSSMIDTMVVIRRLQDIGISEAGSVALYGNYTAYCVTLFNLPPVLIYPIVNTLIPTLCAAKAENDGKKIKLLTDKSLKLAGVIAIPCALGLGVMSAPILKLIFSSEANAEMAAPLLSTLSPAVFLIGVMAVTNGILQAFKLQRYSVISMLFGVVIKAAAAYFLPMLKIGESYLGIYASPISTILFYLTITLINFYFLTRFTDVRVPVFRIYFRPLIAAIICAITAWSANTVLINIFGYNKFFALIAIALAALVYGVLLLLLGGITRSDITLIPKAEKLVDRIPIVRAILK